MSVESAADHPTFALGGNTVTSLAAPARGATEAVLFRLDLPGGGGLPPHHHDHLDVFAVASGGGTVFIDGEAYALATGDSVIVPAGAVHYVEAGETGASLIVTMLAGTKLIREDDGVETVPPWVG